MSVTKNSTNTNTIFQNQKTFIMNNSLLFLWPMFAGIAGLLAGYLMQMVNIQSLKRKLKRDLAKKTTMLSTQIETEKKYRGLKHENDLLKGEYNYLKSQHKKLKNEFATLRFDNNRKIKEYEEQLENLGLLEQDHYGGVY